ncbi:imm11 family protein [Corallococcus macrosporus]|uniref:Immunity MXAN-0049 protein domain-containing protein n=1 Tax=Corallococcus macrosporus DSM 14697 TaxID=1189310 RepID=A0A250K3A5_9BACT|nr:DUF1629 domain-containing protein [Corallococcus macrosporus]ATB50589.1 hypothetical protein MYMAC_006245 [Corallococcus macrosporus DSM 14697]
MFRRLTEALRVLTRRSPRNSPGSTPGAPRQLLLSDVPADARPRTKPAARRAPPRPTRPARYFDLHDDFRIPGRPELSDPVAVDPRQKLDSVWLFTSGARVRGVGRLRLKVTPPGPPLDFSLAGAGLTPIVSARVASVFRELAPHDVQLLPVEVEDRSEPHFILVATRLVRCIDDRACAEAIPYTAADGLPERVGHYRSISGLRVDPTRTNGARVFRTWGWPVSLIVSEGIKEALEHARITGARFAEVTEPPRKPRRKKAAAKKSRPKRR